MNILLDQKPDFDIVCLYDMIKRIRAAALNVCQEYLYILDFSLARKLFIFRWDDFPISLHDIADETNMYKNP